MVNFKRLELQGFKSFAGKTIINFDNTFTGIVGPNGCGKSNVADAVRWVLGEMSAKALRGSKMQDVIFNGTEKKPSMSYCEVSLVFDNSNHIFKTDREEVILTRKLYRSGTSEYYLNNNICRLRDILDIMRDTGAGKDGYSIIGQGKVAEIMQSKPEDRRQIFEEAAGIAKTKAEKVETERKLSRAAEDISRINDIVSELDRQLGPLAKQRDAAQKFFEYKEQMRYQEVNHYLYEREHSVQQKKQIADNVKSFTEELYAKEQEMAKLAVEHNSCMEEIDSIEKLIRSMMEEREKLKVNNEKNSGLMAVHKNKIANLTTERERLTAELETHKSAQNQAELTVEEANKILEIRRQEAYIAEQRKNSIAGKHLAISEEIAGRESSIEKSNSDFFDAFGRLSDVKSTLARFIAEQGSLSNRRDMLTVDIHSCAAILEREELQKQKSISNIERNEKNKVNSKNERAAAMMRFNEIKQSMYLMNEGIRQLMAQISNKEGRIRALIDIANSYEGYQGAVKAVLNDAKDNTELNKHIVGVVGQLIKVPQKYEVAIEAALGASVQHIVTPTDDDAIYIVSYLKKMQYGMATMIPANKARAQELAYEYRGVLNTKGCLGICSDVISYDNQYHSVISQLLGRTVIAEDIETAKAIANRYDYGVKIVTLEGDIIDPRRTITGGSRRQKNAFYLSKERELNDAKDELDTIKIQFAEKQKVYDKSDKESKTIEERIYTLREEVQKIDVDIATENERIATSDKIIAETGERMTRLQDELNGIEERLSNISDEIKSAEGLNTDFEGQKQSAEGFIEQTKTDAEHKRKLRDSLHGALTQAQIDLSALDIELKQIDADIKRITAEIDEETVKISELSISLGSVEAQLEAELKNAPVLEFSLAEKTRLEDIDKQMQLKDMHKDTLRIKLSENERSRDVINDSIRLIMDKRAREESKVEKIESELTSLRERVLGEYELSEDEMMAIRDEENFIPRTAPSAIASLRGKIAQLGSINFNAYEDYEAVKARHDDLSGQLSDLVSAKDDLEKLLAAMTTDMVGKFNKAFEQINVNFKKTFADLFGGGTAELVLIDNSEDKLSAGVGIKVKLPGKAQQDLSLLSGGEQALTSIAILFAILRLRPMPFSILDEIEAALDESNAILLANYLKKYSRDTQFIVITHKKPVMELAGALYGVTMEERGVSKVITVQISEAIKNSEVI